jgi:hypothetical protein
MAPKRARIGRSSASESSPEQEDFAGDLAWSRVQELRDLDTQLEKLQQQLQRAMEFQRQVHMQVRDELHAAINLATETATREPPLTRSLTFFFRKVVRLVRSRST